MGYLVVSSNYRDTTLLEQSYHELFSTCQREKIPVFIGLKDSNTVVQIQVLTYGGKGAQSVEPYPELFPTSSDFHSTRPKHTFWYRDLLFASTEGLLDPED